MHRATGRADEAGTPLAGVDAVVVGPGTGCPRPRTAQDEEDTRTRVRDALNHYLSARHRLRRAESSLEAAEDVIATRVHLVQVLTESGWSPPRSVLAQLALDQALLHEPSQEDRAQA